MTYQRRLVSTLCTEGKIDLVNAYAVIDFGMVFGLCTSALVDHDLLVFAVDDIRAEREESSEEA